MSKPLPSAPQLIEVLIADDHAMVRNGLQRIINNEPDMHVAALACDGSSVLARLEDSCCDIALLDLTMPEPRGTQLIGLIRQRWPQLPILMVSMHNDPGIVRATLAAGANGYITKDSEPDQLVHAIRQVLAGGRYVDASLIEALIVMQSPREREVLTPREREVMRRLAAGQSNNQIARELFLSEKTVSTHKANLMNKLGLNSVADLVRYVDQNKR